ncbi:hypothetical protein ACF09J_07830 [Streptomyces sp. NPDC014889]|uniref:hypothetical protein n=1 Tax=Streptomyces sp. NPDC014889 TaxID=3364928 RepID=UPI0036FEE0B7
MTPKRYTADTINDTALDELYRQRDGARDALRHLMRYLPNHIETDEQHVDRTPPTAVRQLVDAIADALPEFDPAEERDFVWRHYQLTHRVLSRRVEQAEERSRELEDRLTHVRDRWASCRERVGIAADKAIAAEAERDELHAALGLAPGQLHNAALSAIHGRAANIRELQWRAEQAEAAIARVRAESARIRATTRTWEPVAGLIDKALDGEQTAAAHTVSPGVAVVHGQPVADGVDALTTAPERQPAYDAVYAYIRQLDDALPSSKIQRNVIIWQAVAAALDANPTAGGTCDASTYSPLAGGSLIGPCTLRRNHDGPVHNDANGTTWLQQPLITAQARVQQLENIGEENTRRHQSTIARVDELLADVSRTQAERDGAYRERAHLVALLAAMTDGAVIAPAPDVDEPGWQIAYLTIGGRQAAWHISPRDADLVAHIEPVEPDDPRAQWDGHTTQEKYAHIAAVTAELSQQCGPACAEGHTYTGRCEGAGEACAQHPNAPVIGGMCGGCTQYPSDMTKEH